jgi:hypothetical protein
MSVQPAGDPSGVREIAENGEEIHRPEDSRANGLDQTSDGPPSSPAGRACSGPLRCGTRQAFLSIELFELVLVAWLIATVSRAATKRVVGGPVVSLVDPVRIAVVIGLIVAVAIGTIVALSQPAM